MPAPANVISALELAKLVGDQRISASVANIVDTKITLQLSSSLTNTPESTTVSANKPGQILVTLDAKQLPFASPNNVNADFSADPAIKSTPSSPTPLSAALALKPGQQIDLQVIEGGNKPIFAILLPAKGDERIIIEAQKQLLPIQSSPLPLLNNLQQVLSNIEPEATVAETLKRLAREIMGTIPLRTELTESAQLKRAFENSGLFLESKLAELLNGKPELLLQDDMKLKLGKLIDALREQLSNNSKLDDPAISDVLKDSLKKTLGTLAKLTLDQLNSLPKDESPKQGWVLELPFFDNHEAHTLQIEIEQDKAGNSESKQKNWAVSITITPPDLATIHCRVSCYDGSVNARFWSERTDTVDKINTHLDYLKQRLEQNGLTTGFMEAHQGKPPASNTVKKSLTSLLSVKA
jgi:hypothetical protein